MSKRVLLAVFVMLFSGAVVQAQTNFWQDDGVTVYTTKPVEVQGQGKVLASPPSGSFSVGAAAPTGYQFFATRSSGSGLQMKSSYSSIASTTFFANLGPYGTVISHNREPMAGGFTDGAIANPGEAVHLMLGDVVANRQRLFSIASFPGGTETPWFVIKFNGNIGIGEANPAQKLVVAGNVFASGNIGIGEANPTQKLVVAGNIVASGSITGGTVLGAVYQDLAEWVPSATDLEPGTVVVVDSAIGNGVRASATAYDTAVAGVVSAQPGIILGVGDDSKEQIATTGRVRVKADASAGPIAVGDLLVTSDRAGYAMKSVPVDMAGRRFHQPGTIVGKALQALPSGTGEILVLLSLQ